LEPASGSVIAKQAFSVPSAKPGRNRSRWAAVPCFATIVATMAGETTSSSSGQPAAASSSVTMASSEMPAPPPPYSDGTLTPRYPSFAASAHSSSVCPPALARST
jgi:hypothetical protein